MTKDIKYLGVDVGASGLKLVEVKKEEGRAHLVTFGYSEYSTESIDDVLGKPEEKGEELAELIKEAGVSSKVAITGLPMASVFTTLFTFQPMSDKELEPQIKNKIEKLSPIPKEDMVLDWKKVTMDGSDKLIKVSATAASKTMINNYVKLFKAAGLSLGSLETESFALSRALLGRDKSLAAIIDIGSIKTNILIVKEGIPLIHRTIKVGGKNISEALMSRLQVSLEKAEQIKKDLSIKKIEGIEDVLRPIVSSIVNEVKYSQTLYSEQYKNGIIEKLVLTGGIALLVGIDEMLKKETGIRVFVGDPWARIVYKDDLRPVLDKLGAKMSVAIGLALRDII